MNGLSGEQPAADERTGSAVAAAISARRFQLPKITLGLCGFLLSVTLALINLFYAFRGPVVVVQPIEQLILYRDGEGPNSILGFAARVTAINAADSAHGDVLMEARLSPDTGLPSYRYASVVRPVFTSASPATQPCESGTRCISHSGFALIEQPDEPLSVSGGAVRAATLAFPVTGGSCEGNPQDCAALNDFDHAIEALRGKSAQITISLKFFADGTRTLRCAIAPINIDYLRTYGWSTVSCRTSTVAGMPLL